MKKSIEHSAADAGESRERTGGNHGYHFFFLSELQQMDDDVDIYGDDLVPTRRHRAPHYRPAKINFLSV